MPATIYYDRDADLSLLGQKTVAILGYGSQGHAHALNLRDSGCRVIIAQRPGTSNYDRAVRDGFSPTSAADATKTADIIAVLLPDERQADVFRAEILPNLAPGKSLLFAHGFNIRYGQIQAPENVSTILVAPVGPGQLLRSEYLRGAGIPCLIARSENTPAATLSIALAYAKAIGCTRAGAIETTFAEETESDLFGEQVVLCGGLSALLKAGYDTLVEAGYQPELAYFECVHQVKLIVDLIYQGGLAHLRRCISNTAEYGDYTRGPRVITEETRAEMRRILAEIQDGTFARQWIAEHRAGAPNLQATRQQEAAHSSEEIGRRLRALMPWLNAGEE